MVAVRKVNARICPVLVPQTRCHLRRVSSRAGLYYQVIKQDLLSQVSIGRLKT
jgi:hypothetical protein